MSAHASAPQTVLFDFDGTLIDSAPGILASFEAALRTTGRRLFALLVLEERAPKLFEAKIAELRAQGETCLLYTSDAADE